LTARRSNEEQSPRGLGTLNGKWESLFKFTMVVGPMLVTVGIAAQAWILNQLQELNSGVARVSERISVVEANRFSSAEGLKVWEAINSIRVDMSKVPLESPPKWVSDKLRNMEDEMKTLTTQILLLSAGNKRR